MKYNRLGCAGIKISEMSYGSYLTFGEKMDFHQSKACMMAAFDQGINSFDNAEIYNCGISESIMGRIAKNFRREELVISTKILLGDGNQKANDTGLSWKHLVEGTKNSLRRLDMEYVDILYCHRPDHETPIEETVRAMDHIIKSGHAFYWGTSEWSKEEINEAYLAAEKYSCIPPCTEQSEYNMLVKDKVENEFYPLYEKYSMGLTVFSPLAYGILAGRYNFASLDRCESFEPWINNILTRENLEKVELLRPLAAELNCSLAQLSIAWCMQNKNVNSVILGASSVEQLKENISSLKIKAKFTQDLMSEIDSMLN